MPKFETIDHLAGMPEERGARVTPSAHDLLLKEGYHNVVGAYRDPFVDRIASQRHPHRVYLPGTSFDDVHALCCLDRELRKTALALLLDVERLVKNISIYVFCLHRSETESYLNPGNARMASGYIVRRWGLAKTPD